MGVGGTFGVDVAVGAGDGVGGRDVGVAAADVAVTGVAGICAGLKQAARMKANRMTTSRWERRIIVSSLWRPSRRDENACTAGYLRNIACCNIHDVDLQAAVTVGGKRDLLAVRRPYRLDVGETITRQLAQL